MTKNQKIFSILLVLILIIAVFAWTKKTSSPIENTPVATSTPIVIDETNTPAPITPPATSTPITPPVTSPPPATSTPTVTVPPEIWKLPGNTKRVSFTFDGGAGNHSHDEIIAILKKHNLKSTYFLTGKWATLNPEAVREMRDEGHEIFNHTYNHPELTKLGEADIQNELSSAEDAIKSITGVTTKPYFRAPYGDRNAQVLKVAAQSGYQHIYWTIDAWDWRPGWTEETVKARILDNLAPGNIYLMHIGDDITGNILDEVFTEIKARGYTIVPLTEGLK
ncbi:MAG: polysaccharide deacetylase family protein [Parcubacteria group bacterium]